MLPSHQHDLFIESLHSKIKVRLTFYSREDRRQLIRTCAPMDYGPSRRSANREHRYHFWDYDSDQESHVLTLRSRQIVDIEAMPAQFDPAEFIDWECRWYVQRDWQEFS